MKPLLLSSLLLFAGGAQAADTTYADFLATARTQFEAKNFDVARATMQSALAVAKTPDEKAGALLRIAQSFDEQNNTVRAREFYTQALAQTGIAPADKAEALLSMGVDLRKEKQLDQAQKVFESLIASKQTPVLTADNARLQLARTLLEQGLTKRALNMLTTLGKSNADVAVRAAVWGDIASYFEAEKNWGVARDTYAVILGLPNVSPALQAMAHNGRIIAFAKEKDEASALKEMLAFMTEMLSGLSSLSPTVGRERVNAALAVLQNPQIETSPIYVLLAREKLAETNLSEKDWTTGRTQIDDVLKALQMLEAEPARRSSALNLKTVALWNLADSYEREGNSQKSRELLEQLLQIPDVAEFYKDAAQKKLTESKK